MTDRNTNKENEFTQSLLSKPLLKRPGKINKIKPKNNKSNEQDKLESLVKKTGIPTAQSKPSVFILPSAFNAPSTSKIINKPIVYSQKRQLTDIYSEPTNDDQEVLIVNDSQINSMMSEYDEQIDENISEQHINTRLTADTTKCNIDYRNQTSHLDVDAKLERLLDAVAKSNVPARLAEVEKKVNVERRVASLEVMFEKFTETLSELVMDVKTIKNSIVKTAKYEIMLPINDQLDDVNDKIENDPGFASYLEQKLQPYKPTPNCCASTVGLAKIFTDNLLSQYNWDGSHGRKEFRSLKGLNEVLFDAWKGGQYDCKAGYATSIRMQMHAARQRRFQRMKKRV